MTKPSRPIGVSLISLLYALGAILLVPFALFIFVLPETGRFGSELVLLAIIFLVMGILSATVCYGLWTLQSWGHPMAYWMTVITIPIAIIGLLGWFPNHQATSATIISNLGNIALDVWIVIYLAKPQIKALFGTTAVGTAKAA